MHIDSKTRDWTLRSWGWHHTDVKLSTQFVLHWMKQKSGTQHQMNIQWYKTPYTKTNVDSRIVPAWVDIITKYTHRTYIHRMDWCQYKQFQLQHVLQSKASSLCKSHRHNIGHAVSQRVTTVDTLRVVVYKQMYLCTYRRMFFHIYGLCSQLRAYIKI